MNTIDITKTFALQSNAHVEQITLIPKNVGGVFRVKIRLTRVATDWPSATGSGQLSNVNAMTNNPDGNGWASPEPSEPWPWAGINSVPFESQPSSEGEVLSSSRVVLRFNEELLLFANVGNSSDNPGGWVVTAHVTVKALDAE